MLWPLRRASKRQEQQSEWCRLFSNKCPKIWSYNINPTTQQCQCVHIKLKPMASWQPSIVQSLQHLPSYNFQSYVICLVHVLAWACEPSSSWLCPGGLSVFLFLFIVETGFVIIFNRTSCFFHQCVKLLEQVTMHRPVVVRTVFELWRLS